MNECLSPLLGLVDDKLVLHHIETRHTNDESRHATHMNELYVKCMNEVCHVYE
jgi:hypothetical protein